MCVLQEYVLRTMEDEFGASSICLELHIIERARPIPRPAPRTICPVGIPDVEASPKGRGIPMIGTCLPYEAGFTHAPNL